MGACMKGRVGHTQLEVETIRIGALLPLEAPGWKSGRCDALSCPYARTHARMMHVRMCLRARRHRTRMYERTLTHI